MTKEPSIESKVREVLIIAQYFQIMNETKWNFFDDDFYIINRRWFDSWKGYIAYDYIALEHVTK